MNLLITVKCYNLKKNIKLICIFGVKPKKLVYMKKAKYDTVIGSYFPNLNSEHCTM